MTRRQNTGWLLGMGVALLLDLAIVLTVPMSTGMAIVLGLVLGFTCSVAGIVLARPKRTRVMRCPECGRVASVPEWCERPICVHAWDGCVPEVWDGETGGSNGEPIELSPNKEWRKPGPETWTAMVPDH